MGLNESRACTVTNYQHVGEPWGARVLYRTQEYLEVREAKTAREVFRMVVAVVAARTEGAAHSVVVFLALKEPGVAPWNRRRQHAVSVFGVDCGSEPRV